MPIPSTNNEPVVGAMAQVWASLLGVCEQIKATQWDLVTDCPGWTVKDQLSHLIGIERMLLGEAPPPPLTEVPDHVHQRVRGDERGVGGGPQCRRPAKTVFAELVEITNRRIEELRAMPTSRFEEIGWSPVGEVPYREFMETRILDSWAHEQDIRRALGRPGGRNGVGEATASTGASAPCPIVVGKQVAPADGTSVLFAVVGVMGRQILVRMVDGRAEAVAASPDARPTVTLSMDQEAFWRLGFGRVEPDAPVGHRTRFKSMVNGTRLQGARRDGLHDLTDHGPGSRTPRADRRGSAEYSAAGTLTYSYASHSRTRRGQQGPSVCRDRRIRDRQGPRSGHAQTLT